MKKNKYNVGDTIITVKQALGFPIGTTGIVVELAKYNDSIVRVRVAGTGVLWNFFLNEIEPASKLHKALL